MRRYCLTYDAINSENWEGNELKLKIFEVLKGGGATITICPVASTILFDDPARNTTIVKWSNLIIQHLNEDIHYYLCLVAKNTDGKKIERAGIDQPLRERSKELWENLP